MSFCRDGVTFPSGDGFRYGMFDTWQTGDDPEWDVEVDWGTFQWVSDVHPTASEAYCSYDGANPGGYTEDDEGEQYADMVVEYLRRQEDLTKRLRAAKIITY